jgi:hypothetical protein
VGEYLAQLQGEEVGRILHQNPNRNQLISGGKVAAGIRASLEEEEAREKGKEATRGSVSPMLHQVGWRGRAASVAMAC